MGRNDGATAIKKSFAARKALTLASAHGPFAKDIEPPQKAAAGRQIFAFATIARAAGKRQGWHDIAQIFDVALRSCLLACVGPGENAHAPQQTKLVRPT